TRGNEGTIFLIEAPKEGTDAAFVRHVKKTLQQLIPMSGDSLRQIGISSVTERSGLRKAYRQSREVAQCVERFSAGRQQVLTVDDLGPARLLVANSDTPAIRAYVQDTIGPLRDDPSHIDLFETLNAYFEHHRSVKVAANRLGVHENTIRLRLSKINTLLNVDILTDAQHQLTV